MTRETIRILHCADLHLGSDVRMPGENGKIRQLEINSSFERITSLCKREDVDLLLIAGDFFDKINIDQAIVDDVIYHIGDIPDTIVAIAPGNHDPLSADSYYHLKDWPENTIIFNNEGLSCVPFERKGLCVWGYGFGTTHESGFFESNIIDLDSSLINICVVHGDLAFQAPDSPYNPIPESIISDVGFDYIALGHVHKRTDILKSRKTFYAYPGTPVGHGFDETGDLGVYIGEIGKGVCNLKFRKIDYRSYLVEKINLTEFKSNAEVSQKVLENLKKKYPDNYHSQIFKIILSGRIDSSSTIDTNSIESRINQELFFSRVEDKTLKLIDFEKIASEESLRGLFVRDITKRLEKTDNENEENIMRALQYGLQAFEGEVKINADNIDID